MIAGSDSEGHCVNETCEQALHLQPETLTVDSVILIVCLVGHTSEQLWFSCHCFPQSHD